LLQLDLAAGVIDLIRERVAQILLARERRFQLDAEEVDVGGRLVGRGDRFARRTRVGFVSFELCAETGAESALGLAVVCGHAHLAWVRRSWTGSGTRARTRR